MNVIAKGAQAPDFDLAGHDGRRYRLSDFKGRPVVLAFYPLDFSPICTRENTCFQNDLAQFNHLDAQVLGISVDHVWAHKVFAERLRVSYPLLADFLPRGAVAQSYGLYIEEKGHSARATVVVDRQGRVLEDRRTFRMARPWWTPRPATHPWRARKPRTASPGRSPDKMGIGASGPRV